MRRGRRLIERIDRNGAEYAERHGEWLLERRAAFGLLDILRERGPWQIDPGALRLGRGRLRLGAADGRDAAFAARDALRRLMQIADRALAADRAVIDMRRLRTDPRCELFLRVVVAPAQEIDDVERADLAEQLCAGVGLRAFQGVFEQSERLEAGSDVLGTIDDFADADDDGDVVFGERGVCHFLLFHFPRESSVLVLSVIASEASYVALWIASLRSQ